MVRKVWRAVDRVGLYIPGGKTPLFSTLLMLAIPAKAAGVKEIVVVTPPASRAPAQAGAQNAGTTGLPAAREHMELDPIIALAADICGITHVWTVGGAQAIAALAFGAGDIPRVDKICGPGNAWVAEAKSYAASLSGGPAIDMPAGPSELLVVADDSANPVTVAADLLSQAEHDASAQVILVTTSVSLAMRWSANLQALRRHCREARSLRPLCRKRGSSSSIVSERPSKWRISMRPSTFPLRWRMPSH